MITDFELGYLFFYFYTLSGFFVYSLNLLIHYSRERKLLEHIEQQNDCTSLLCNENFYDLCNDLSENYDLDDDIDKVILCVDDDIFSRILILLVNELFPNSSKLIFDCSESHYNEHFIEKYCLDNTKYFNKSEELDHETFEDRRKIILQYCENCDVKYCFMNYTNNDLMDDVNEAIFTNNFNINFDNYEIFSENDVTIFNPLINTSNFFSFMTVWDDNVGLNTNDVNEKYYYFQDLLYDNWRDNLLLTYNQLKDKNNVLNDKIQNLFNITKYKYGVTINLEDDRLPYWLWENIFNQIIDDFNINVEKQTIQTLYFNIVNNKKDDGEILNDWRYNYNNQTFILYNFTELQERINSCVLDNNSYDVNNSIERFLDGKLIYEVMDEGEDTLEYRNINMNLDDTNNESIFTNFSFKLFKPGEIGFVN